jgi:hypothetical protein
MDTSLVVNTELYPIYLQDLELIEFYVEAFRKVFGHLDEVMSD